MNKRICGEERALVSPVRLMNWASMKRLGAGVGSSPVGLRRNYPSSGPFVLLRVQAPCVEALRPRHAALE